MKKISIRNSLFTKITFITLLCIVVPMLVNLFYTTHQSSEALEEEVINSLSHVTNEKNSQVDLVFASQFALADSVVEDLYVRNFFINLEDTNEVDQSELTRIRNRLEEKMTNADGLYENVFYSFDGSAFVDGVGGASVGHVFDRENEAYYYEQLENPGVAASDYMYSPITGRPVIAVSDSILNNAGEVISVYVIALDVNKLTEQLVTGNDDDSIHTMIIDPSGLTIASKEEEFTLNLNFSEEENLLPFFEKMGEESIGNGFIMLNGVENIVAFEKNEDFGFYVITYMPVEQYTSSIKELANGILLVIVASLVITSIAVVLFVRSFVKPIKLLSTAAKNIAGGDLTTTDIKVTNKDEVGELASSFQIMVANLRNMVEQIQVTSEKVASSAEEFSATSEQSAEISKQVAAAIQTVALGAETQAQNASTSSGMVQEVTTGVTLISQSAQNVTDAASDTTDKANSGALHIKSSISEIEAMNQAIQDVAVKMENLGERTQEIGQIVGVITQIADQTNLLALNAAIEAARAGEHGRGFAVVADEVRKLAEQSKQSSQQISNLIKSIQVETAETVTSMIATSETSAEGIEAIRSVEQTFTDIRGSVRNVTKQLEEVSSATEQMRASMEHITTNMNEINNISTDTASKTQEVSASVQEQLASTNEIASSSIEMAKLAEELQELVENFKLNR
ncbi:methyl-accepting chemotaxis protein [Evansella sp. AB-rgal1]|uniref:methyl-accepting chemotaxis protein n=1 Tax=Evansella sp. AB-rgal1 TaxID=3242696 RepID=UPI00359D3F0D